MGGFPKNVSCLWLADSGASCHMTFEEEGMFDCRVIHTPIKIGSGKSMVATKIGKKRLTLKGPNGTTLEIVLRDCKLVPSLWVNKALVSSVMKDYILF
jgi:hypothetical protein